MIPWLAVQFGVNCTRKVTLVVISLGFAREITNLMHAINARPVEYTVHAHKIKIPSKLNLLLHISAHFL